LNVASPSRLTLEDLARRLTRQQSRQCAQRIVKWRIRLCDHVDSFVDCRRWPLRRLALLARMSRSSPHDNSGRPKTMTVVDEATPEFAAMPFVRTGGWCEWALGVERERHWRNWDRARSAMRSSRPRSWTRKKCSETTHRYFPESRNPVNISSIFVRASDLGLARAATGSEADGGALTTPPRYADAPFRRRLLSGMA